MLIPVQSHAENLISPTMATSALYYCRVVIPVLRKPTHRHFRDWRRLDILSVVPRGMAELRKNIAGAPGSYHHHLLRTIGH